jgi:hypothetical protein
VFRLIKLLVGVAALGAFVWFGANVPLGSRTLFQHLQAIGRTRATQDLLDGTRETAKPLVDSVRRRLAHDSSSAPVLPDGGTAAPPADEISDDDRQHLKKLLAGEHGEHPARGDHPAR